MFASEDTLLLESLFREHTRKETTMKSITGAILLLAASVYAVGFVLATPIGDRFFSVDMFVSTLGLVGVAHFILGIYFLFAKDKP